MATPTIDELLEQGAVEIEIYRRYFSFRKFKFNTKRVDTDKRIFKTIKGEYFTFCDDESVFYTDSNKKLHWIE